MAWTASRISVSMLFLVVTLLLLREAYPAFESVPERRLKERGHKQGDSFSAQWPVAEWQILRVPSEIKTSSYDPICDPASSSFKEGNLNELLAKNNFAMTNVNILGALDAVWKLAQVALAWYSKPELPLPTAIAWLPSDEYWFANRLDPKLGGFGRKLAEIVVPPSKSTITAQYMRFKMSDRAVIGGVGMPWSQNIQVLVFLSQAMQGLIAAWVAVMTGPNNFFWLKDSFELTFRFEIWAEQLFYVLRLLMTFIALQRFCGIDVVSAKASRAYLQDMYTFYAYPWSFEGQGDTVGRVEQIVWLLDVFSKYIVLPTAAVMMLPFLPSFCVNLLPGAALAAVIIAVYNRHCRDVRYIQLEVQEPFGFRAHQRNILPALGDVGELVFVLACSTSCGYLISFQIKNMLSKDTYLCPYAKMNLLNVGMLEDVNSLAGYATTMIVIGIVMIIALYIAAIVLQCRAKSTVTTDERKFDVDWLYTLLHGLWVTRCSRELADNAYLFQALAFAQISSWEFDEIPCPPNQEQQQALLKWAAQFRDRPFPDFYVREWGNPVVGIGKCLRKSTKSKISAKLLRDELGTGADDLIKIGCGLCEISEAGFTTGQLKGVGYTALALKQQLDISLQEFHQAGYDAQQLKDADFSASELREFFDARALIDAGFDAAALTEAGFGQQEVARALVKEKLHVDYLTEKFNKLVEAGFDASELLKKIEMAMDLMLLAGGGKFMERAHFPDPVLASAAQQSIPELPPALFSTLSSLGSSASVVDVQNDKATLKDGDVVEVHGLKKAPDLNGMVGKVSSDPDSDCWVVELLDKTVTVKAENLRVIDVESELEEGDVVALHSLQVSTELNAKLGKILCKVNDRWRVQLDWTDQTIDIKRTNLRKVDNPNSISVPPTSSTDEQEKLRQERIDKGRTGPCMILQTSVDSGAVACMGGDNTECPWCSKFFCNYHLPVNNDDGIGSFGGHVCQHAPVDANQQTGFQLPAPPCNQQ
eukprot:TRINITY_DN88054_c0_g1_i1.p1 TRINITY_DN88054_c0_g1~~TRINITY_DN88054_c0_g1_i1.p1  ORF type:complete len:987 (-),score=168.11 TRINITY_DN88054_c0_g1_i1:105-3065(-)